MFSPLPRPDSARAPYPGFLERMRNGSAQFTRRTRSADISLADATAVPAG
jgi:hypothetical protein